MKTWRRPTLPYFSSTLPSAMKSSTVSLRRSFLCVFQLTYVICATFCFTHTHLGYEIQHNEAHLPSHLKNPFRKSLLRKTPAEFGIRSSAASLATDLYECKKKGLQNLI